MTNNIAPEIVRQLLRYEPETGKLFWLPRKCASAAAFNTRFAGGEAFTAISSWGYKKGKIEKRDYTAHRVIWALQTGAWPVAEIDHINRVRHDNRWSNLRAATREENARNNRGIEGSSSIYLGVSKVRNGWKAQINVAKKQLYLGRFSNEEDAAKCYDAAARKYFGEFAGLNFPEKAA
jgi:hypothetical protein